MSSTPQLILSTTHGVARSLSTFPDFMQPSTGSVVKFSGVRRKDHGDGLRYEVVEFIDLRTELARRVSFLDARDRELLFMWYVRQLHVDDIATELGISRRQCFRRRVSALRAVADVDEREVTHV